MVWVWVRCAVGTNTPSPPAGVVVVGLGNEVYLHLGSDKAPAFDRVLIERVFVLFRQTASPYRPLVHPGVSHELI